MVGSIESPISIEGMMTLPDGNNVYGNWHDDYFENEMLHDSTQNNANISPQYQTPIPNNNTMEMPPSLQTAQTMHIAVESEIPVNISVPVLVQTPTAPNANNQIQQF